MKLFDSHFHYDEKDGDPAEYWNRIKIPELAYALAVGADYQQSRQARHFAHEIEGAWFACGAHPEYADQYGPDIRMFDEFRHDPKLVAIGEIGLDYYYENSHRESQLALLEKFLELALEWQLPAVVHCRDLDDRDLAYADAYDRLRDFTRSGGTVDVHCFSGTTVWAGKFLDLGAYLGVTGMVTFKKAENIRTLARYLPDDRLLIETDSPYLAPVPYRGQPNHPGYVIKVAEKLAELKNITTEQLAAITTANAARLLKVTLP